MTDLAAYFRSQLPARIAALASAREGLAGPEAEESRAMARRLGHQLAGSGASFGYPEVSEAGRGVEHATGDGLSHVIEKLLVVLRSVAEGDATSAAGEAEILVVEDDEILRPLVVSSLEGPGRKVRTAATVAQARAEIESSPPTLLVLDLLLPDGDGRNLLASLRESAVTAAVPVVVLSARNTHRTKAECFALGADAFLEKPVDPPVLRAAVEGILRRAHGASRAARVDALTGLPNRAAFHEAYVRAAARAGRAGEPLTIGILDLDRFKSVNDTHGHAVGDEVLRRAAQVVPKSLRASDLLARWGGEEFVLLFPDTDPEGAARALEKSLASLRAEAFVGAKGASFSVSFSVGVAATAVGIPIEEAVASADRFLYEAKAAGRGRVVFQGASQASAPARPVRIVVAEDDPVVTKLLRHRLSREGWEVSTHPDGAKAWADLDARGADLVISDIQMPSMDGLELLERVRASPEREKTPFLLLTALGGEADVARGLDRGADDYLVKPFSPSELLARVRRLLR